MQRPYLFQSDIHNRVFGGLWQIVAPLPSSSHRGAALLRHRSSFVWPFFVFKFSITIFFSLIKFKNSSTTSFADVGLSLDDILALGAASGTLSILSKLFEIYILLINTLKVKNVL